MTAPSRHAIGVSPTIYAGIMPGKGMDPSELKWPPKWRRDEMPKLANAWMASLRAGLPAEEDDAGVDVTLMNFTATHDVQWAFLEAAVAAAESGEEFCAIAAGPFEHLLSHHGETYIDEVERRCRDQPKWKQVADGSWRYRMSDSIWARVQAIQERADKD
jgi:hypothetical protein